MFNQQVIAKPKVVPLQGSSPAQKKFNSLLESINAQRFLLVEWQEGVLLAQQLAVEKLKPLHKTLGEYQAKLVLLLDKQLSNQKFTTQQQDKLQHLILKLTEVLIAEHRRDDLKLLSAKYSAANVGQTKQNKEILPSDLSQQIEHAFDIPLEPSETDLNQIADYLDQLNNELEQQRMPYAKQYTRPQKKSAKQLAKEQRSNAENAKVSKSIQTIFRQLSSALHPDREPDPIERERKTELMQKVTVAYSKRDLLTLLELQLKAEQIDQAQLNNMAEERLKHYNQVLTSQLNQLKAEVFQQEQLGRQIISALPFTPIVPKHLLQVLKQDQHGLHTAISKIQQDLRDFQDINVLKSWLKHYQIDF